MAAVTTHDGLLDGRITIEQPQHGYRAGSDAILLAAAVRAQAGESVLDAGAGVGAAALCLAWRCAGLTVHGLELQSELAELARQNAADNGLADRVNVLAGDIRQPPVEVGQRVFDHCICNPPFYAEGRASPSPDAGKALAHGEGQTTLAHWLAFCLRRTAPGGSVTIIHRAERLPAILSRLSPGAGDLVIYPLWPKPGRPAKRVIVQARVQGRGPAVLHPGLRLHNEDGRDTATARAVLREGAALDLSSRP